MALLVFLELRDFPYIILKTKNEIIFVSSKVSAKMGPNIMKQSQFEDNLRTFLMKGVDQGKHVAPNFEHLSLS